MYLTANEFYVLFYDFDYYDTFRWNFYADLLIASLLVLAE